MFSQPSMKRIPLLGVNPQGNYMQPQEQYPMGDNMSLYSTASTASNVSNIKRRMLPEELNFAISNSLEMILPKIAEDCARMVMEKVSNELERQGKEIENLYSQLLSLEESIKTSFQSFSGNCTPVKLMKKAESDLQDLDKSLLNQSIAFENYRSRLQNDVTMINEQYPNKIHQLKENLILQKQLNDRMSSSMKNRAIDLFGIKHLIDEKLTYLSNDFKFIEDIEPQSKQRNQIQNERMGEVLNLLQQLEDKINQPKHRSPQIQNKQTFQGLEINSNDNIPFIFNKNQAHNLATPTKSLIQSSNITNNIQHIPSYNVKAANKQLGNKLKAKFNKFSF
jgi:hypothetical protein